MATIDQFKAQLTSGGVRSNRFQVFIPRAGERVEFLVKAAQIPAETFGGPIEVNFRGAKLKLPGERTYEDWTVTVLNDVDFSIRSAFEKWMNLINKMEDNTGEQDPAIYQPDAYVHQLDRDGSTLRTYKFHDVFPTQVSQIDLSYETTDAIEEFTVEFQVQWWEALRGVGANAGGEDIN